MTARKVCRCFLLPLVLGAAGPVGSVGADPSATVTPQPRPRVTEAVWAKVEEALRSAEASSPVAMDRVIVREDRLPSGPPKEQQREGKFTVTDGGYLLRNRGETFTTEVGLWRHIDIFESTHGRAPPVDADPHGFRPDQLVTRLAPAVSSVTLRERGG